MVLHKQLRRAQVIAFFGKLRRCLVGDGGVCDGAYWARELHALGGEVRLMPAQYLKAHIKGDKTTLRMRKQFVRRWYGRQCASDVKVSETPKKRQHKSDLR